MLAKSSRAVLLSMTLLGAGQGFAKSDYATCEGIQSSRKQKDCEKAIDWIMDYDQCLRKRDKNSAADCNELRLYYLGIKEIDSDDFVDNDHITAVNIIGNDIETIPVDFFKKFKNLRQINLTWNENIRELPCESLQGLSKLIELKIYHLNIEKFCADQFKGLKKLEMLDFSHNNLESLPDGLLSDLKALEKIEMDSNDEEDSGAIAEIPAGFFDRNRKLRSIDLDGNGLKTLPAHLFDDLPKLKKLDLVQNKFKSIPEGLFDKLSSKVTICIDPSDKPLNEELKGDPRKSNCNN